MKNSKKYNISDLTINEIFETNGGGLSTGMNSLFRSSIWIGSKALDAGLATLGLLAGMVDGINDGMNN